MSRQTDRKKARRRKRLASRDDAWLPEGQHDRLAAELAIADDLEHFDEQLTGRGWVFDEGLTDEDGVIWVYPPSAAEVSDDVVSATTVVLTADEDGEIAHVVFVGTLDDYQFGLDELFDHIDTIEAYRMGAPAPAFS